MTGYSTSEDDESSRKRDPDVTPTSSRTHKRTKKQGHWEILLTMLLLARQYKPLQRGTGLPQPHNQTIFMQCSVA